MDMEVDGIENLSNPSDGGKFSNLKAFVTAAREFEATHSESAVNLMTRYLGLIASSCDLSIFSPGRSEVCAFFSSLWRVMCDGRGPHWAGVAVLARAAIEPSARHALTHTYKFMPILARLLSDSISNDKKIKLLTVMQEISYGIKISWQESYLSSLMKQLTEWITQPMTEPQLRTIGHKSLTVLVNVCYGNLPAIYALMRTVDTKDFVVHLISLKEGGYGGVEVCRLLLCLSGATRGAASTRQPDVHSYLCCTMRTFNKAVSEGDATQLLHAYTFVNDLCSDSNLRSYVLTYPHFVSALEEALKNTVNCLRNVLKFLTVLVSLDLYSLRCHHSALVCLCMKASRSCLPESLELFAAIVSQYKDEGRLPQELITVISDGLPGLLVPPALEPGKAGVQWNGVVGAEASQQAVVVGCRTALSLAPLDRHWEAALARMLAHHQVRKLLCVGLTSTNGPRRRQILQLVKHHYFPSDQMNQVFGESLQGISESSTDVTASSSGTGCAEGAWCGRLAPAQEHAVDALVAKLNEKLRDGKISDIATSSVMELYGYKMTCLEQRLHSHSVALQSLCCAARRRGGAERETGASEHMASLQHSLAMLQATNSSQQDVLYTTQMQNERHKKTIEDLHKQLEDAETTLRGFRAKLAAEKLDKENQKENLHKEFRAQLATLETEMKLREREFEDRLKASEVEHRALQKKLEQQTSKNSELAGVLIKFEERVKQRDKKLEDAAGNEASLRKEIDHRDMTIKQLEKTVLERENRLYQLTTQLEEMKRVQEMVAKLMSKSASTSMGS
ncbi:hypothetical protein SFRURICE_017930 [Spodoptera frugiperda]|nr:hypothetical protein SFRURICE_017930 [Spodoptera frugiperda]